MDRYVLITGSAGLIGSEAVEFFAKKKFKIIGIDNNYRKFFFGNSGSVGKRMEFDVRFYLVAILFIIFDLEIAFLFPWAISLGKIGLLGFWSMMIFLFILTIGFIYEWKKGALDWD